MNRRQVLSTFFFPLSFLSLGSAKARKRSAGRVVVPPPPSAFTLADRQQLLRSFSKEQIELSLTLRWLEEYTADELRKELARREVVKVDGG